MLNVHYIAMQGIFNQASIAIDKRLKTGLLGQMLYGKGHVYPCSGVVCMQAMYRVFRYGRRE